MSFLVPTAALFALTIPVVVLLYFLKLKRQRREVSSTILWRRSVEDLMANAPFQRLRRNLLLLLQVLVLLLAVLALMRPLLRWTGLERRSMIVLIDRSASMQSTDVTPSRLEAAKQQALRLVTGMTRGDRMAVLAFSDHAEVVQSLTDDRTALRRAIAAIEPHDTATRLSEALAIARAMAEAHRNSEIYIISDGALDESNLSLEAMPNVTFISVGERCDNVAIVDLDLRETFGPARSAELFVGIRNYAPRPRRATLRLLIDGNLADAKEINLRPRQAKSEVLRNIAASEALLEVRLEAADDLALDNVARGVLKRKSQYDVLLVSDGNYFIERLLSLQPDFRLNLVNPSQYSPSRSPDLTIFDNWAPEKLVPGNYLMLHAVPPLAGVSVSTQSLTNPPIIDWHRLHPLTRYVNFEPIIIRRALRLDVPAWSQVLAETTDAPMIVLLEDRNVRCLVIAFSIFDSDWPLHVSFPVFFTNAVRWLASRSGDQARICYRAGETVRLTAPPGRQEIEVRPPRSPSTKVGVDQDGIAYFAAAQHAGVYDVYSGDKRIGRFAVNLLSENESDTSPTSALSFQGRLLESRTEEIRSNTEIWPWLVFAALAVLTLEWLIYCKRCAL